LYICHRKWWSIDHSVEWYIYIEDNEELTREYGSYGAPCNEFVRKLRDASPAFDNAVILLSELLWDGESNQGYLPLYIEMKARRDADNSIRLQHNDGWY